MYETHKLKIFLAVFFFNVQQIKLYNKATGFSFYSLINLNFILKKIF